QVEDLIADKKLLVVPSGPLTQLPFQVLVTAPPKEASVAYHDVAWLAHEHAITVLPAVSLLKSLRQYAKQSRATLQYVGFGNPRPDGNPAQFPKDEERAKLARGKHRAPTLGHRLASGLGFPHRATRAIRRGDRGFTDVADTRRQAPLPETADELCE